jgi:secreted trypsin-like serine protease
MNNQRSASNPKKPINSRVIGSITTKPLEFPWIRSLKLATSENYGEHGCSGSLLNNEWVITNAGCFSSKYNKIVFGEHSLATKENLVSQK